MLEQSDNYNQIEKQFRNIFMDAVSPYNDGWTQSACKRDLVMLKYKLDKLISKCPNFGDVEKQWEQELIIDKLSN